jgi:hypothetical protein
MITLSKSAVTEGASAETNTKSIPLPLGWVLLWGKKMPRLNFGHFVLLREKSPSLNLEIFPFNK